MKLQLWFMVLVLVATAACGGDSSGTNPPAAPTPAAVGPIMVYAIDQSVVAYDVGAEREIRRTTLWQTFGPVLDKASGEAYFIPQGQEMRDVMAVNVLTGDQRLVYRSERPLVYSIAVSRDGSSLAVSESATGSEDTGARVVDLAAGTATTVATFTRGVNAFRFGQPAPVVWRDDATGFVVAGVAPKEGTMSTATVFLNGSVVPHGQLGGNASPSGRKIATDNLTGYGCDAPPQVLRMFDTDLNAEVARVEGPPGGRLLFKEWSPAGDSFLYDQYEPLAGPVDHECQAPTPDVTTRKSFLLRAGREPELVADVDAFLAAWHPEARVEMPCASGPANALGWCTGSDSFRRNLVVNGVSVNTGENIRVLGFIPVPR